MDHGGTQSQGPKVRRLNGSAPPTMRRASPRARTIAHGRAPRVHSPRDAPERPLVARQLRLRLVLRSGLAHHAVLGLAHVAAGADGRVDLEHVRVGALAPAQESSRTSKRVSAAALGRRSVEAARRATHFICCATPPEEANTRSCSRCASDKPPKPASMPVLSPSRFRRSACRWLAGLKELRAVARPVGTMRCCGAGWKDALCDESHSRDGA